MLRFVFLFVVFGAAVVCSPASADDEDPLPYLEDLPLEIRGEEGWDPREAPLPLLSRDPAVGRAGARRIGEARRALSSSDLWRLWGEIRGAPAGPWGDLLRSGKGGGSLLLRERQLLSSAGLRRIDLLQWERGDLAGRVAAEARWNAAMFRAGAAGGAGVPPAAKRAGRRGWRRGTWRRSGRALREGRAFRPPLNAAAVAECIAGRTGVCGKSWCLAVAGTAT